MPEEVLERRGRSLSMSIGMGMDNASAAIPGPAKPNSNGNSNLRAGQRLRAAASFSPHHPPSTMAVRRTGTFGGGGSKPLVAIAGPMGITVVDATAPQRPWMVLNYSSSSAPSSSSSGIDGGGNVVGGISTMAFQPCHSTIHRVKDADDQNYGDGHGHAPAFSPILLATARGKGILIWDCSGQALSPLLGRLTASDSGGGGGGAGIAVAGNSSGPSKRGADDSADGHSLGSEESGAKPGPPPSAAGADTASVPEAMKSMISPISLERKSSLVSVSSSSSLVGSNLANAPGGALNRITTASGAGASSGKSSASSRGDVTSLDWKGPSAPVLLATCGRSACVWDLRTSLFSGVGTGGGSGARPTSRFVAPRDEFYHDDATLIHCAYSHDESSHTFATMDSLGVVRVWDDRKADRPTHSFLACPGGGVGIASIASSTTSADAGPRFVTWGMDEAHSCGDDLVVKVWTPKSRRSTSSSDAEGSEREDDVVKIAASYHTTSRITMAGAAAARVHPSFPNGILIFRDNSSQKEEGPHHAAGGLSTPSGFGVPAGEIKDGAEGLVKSPDQMIVAPVRRSPDMGEARRPPSPPPLMLEETSIEPQEPKGSSFTHDHKGWEAELWRVNAGDSPLPMAVAEGAKEENRGAQKVAAFKGGGTEEDALSFAPGRADFSGAIAVDLALGSADAAASGVEKEELSVCVLTTAGRLTLYGVPEAAGLLVRERDTESEPKKQHGVIKDSILTRSASSRVYRQSSDHLTSQWWNKKEEEELFGDATDQASPKKSPVESLRPLVARTASQSQFDNELASNSAVVSRGAENLNEKASAPDDVDLTPSMAAVGERSDVGAGATGDVQNNNLPIDPAKAARVPCPPLCGVAFSGVGGMVTFHNGPVKRMWSHFQSNGTSSPTGPSNLSNVSFKQHMNKSGDVVSSAPSDDDSSANNLKSVDQSKPDRQLPRSLSDLIDMNVQSQAQQWGMDGENEQPNDAASDVGGSSSSDGSSSFEDAEMLDIGSDESESDDSEGFFHVKDSSHRDSLDNMFDDYFSSSRKPLLGSEHDGPDASEDKFAGLPSLSPAVAITTKYDAIMLNGQTPELSHLLDLGNVWWLTTDFAVPDQNGDKHWDGVDGSVANTAFPRNSSDPFMAYGKNAEAARSRSSSLSLAPKPSKQSSMIGSLKKLFAHNLPAAMTPPDQRMLNSKSKKKSAQTNQLPPVSDSDLNNPERCERVHLGVYMLENPQTPEAASERLAVSHKICLHNARVCLDCGQKTKADTWTLLAQTIESIFTFEMDDTDGWGGDEDVLTTGLVEQILRWYEAAGDVQMLSAIVCVLTFGRDRRSASCGSGGRYRLLPKFDERRYDNYLRRYADLLYGWGILTVRSEISKRLAYSTPGAGSETITRVDKGINSNEAELLPNSGVAPGVGFAPLCRKCAEPATMGSRGDAYCNKCGRHPFRCSICCGAVRGACTWCPLCGHGGHVEHMMQWFEQQTVCPTGCGCVCMTEGHPNQPNQQFADLAPVM